MAGGPKRQSSHAMSNRIDGISFASLLKLDVRRPRLSRLSFDRLEKMSLRCSRPGAMKARN
jgi:hypothetical protein